MIICKSEYFFIDTGNSNDPGSCQTMYCFPYLIFEKIRLKRVKKKTMLHSMDMRSRAWTWT